MAEEKKEQRAPKLMQNKFTLDANTRRMVHFALVPVGTTVQQMKDPEFWAHVASSLRVRARIEVEPEDGSYLAVFVVRSVGPNWARVEKLEEYRFTSAEALVQKAKNFKVEWGGPVHKHRVKRLSDNQIMKLGFDTPEQAAEWLAANQEAMAAT